jgi:hypothetical protein
VDATGVLLGSVILMVARFCKIHAAAVVHSLSDCLHTEHEAQLFT